MTDTPPAKPRAKPRHPRGHGTAWLDNILVLGSLLIVGGVLLGLFLATVPTANLPIIAGVTGTLVGTVIGGYAGYRWGASASMRRDEPAA